MELSEYIKQCNLKLDALATNEHRFVAWIIYSSHNKCYIAGVDTYTNDDENMLYVPAKEAGPSPIEAMKAIYNQILKWEAHGAVLDPFG